jgi:hypothetical protein
MLYALPLVALLRDPVKRNDADAGPAISPRVAIKESRFAYRTIDGSMAR